MTSSVERLEHLRNTPTTDFNVGTDVTRRLDRSVRKLRRWLVPFSLTSTGIGGSPVRLGGSGGYEYGVEGATVEQRAMRTGNALRMKVPGAIFTGLAELRFVHRTDSGAAGTPATPATTDGTAESVANPAFGTAKLGFKVLTEAAEAREVAEPTVFRSVDRDPARPLRLEAPALPAGTKALRPRAREIGAAGAAGR